MLYLIIRPKVIAAINFFNEYFVAPAAITKGIIGIGGGRSAGMATAKNPQRANVAVTFSMFLCDNFFSSVSFPPLRASR